MVQDRWVQHQTCVATRADDRTRLRLLIHSAFAVSNAIVERRKSMFHNLIESSSHTQELKRRGSFVLFTTATYVVLFAITGLVSIYAYDSRVEDQSFEVAITMLPPVELNARA